MNFQTLLQQFFCYAAAKKTRFSFFKTFIVIVSLPLAGYGQVNLVGKLKVSVIGNDLLFARTVSVAPVSAHVYDLVITLKSERASIPRPLKVDFKIPSQDIQSYLPPYGANALPEPTSLYSYGLSRMIPVSFNARPVFTSATIDQPAVTFINTGGKNRLTVAASELVYPVTLMTGEREEDGVGFDFKIGLFDYGVPPMKSYTVKIRFDERDIPYNRSQQDLQDWWKKENTLNYATIPLKTHLPFYCTWYALKADGVNAENVERQARLAKELGCETIIVDDGWQKAQDAKAGYCLYNGDWRPDKIRFKDFKGHVKKVHELGMNYMLWVGPSMVGEKSAIYEQLKDKMLYRAEWAKAWVVDPRFPEVRKYLTQRLIDQLKESGIDGYKIDFMDLINSRYAGEKAGHGNGRDYESIEEATVKLLADIYEGCKQINPDVMIEYRQFYTSPVLQQYANMFRAVDCPNNLQENRTRTLDARNLNRQVIHADPLAWNENEDAPASALQLLHTFLSVPQISTDLTKLDATHHQMLKFLLQQWREFNLPLTRGKAINHGPEAYYTWSETSAQDRTVIAVYQPVVVKPSQILKTSLLINGTHGDNLVLELSRDFGSRKIQVFTCQGKLVRSQQLRFKGLLKIQVPPSGLIRVSN